MPDPASPATPRKRPCRPFTLADGMILIGATALTLRYFRGHWDDYRDWASGLGFGMTPMSRVDVACCFASAFAGPWTLAYLVIRHLPPRPSRRRIGRQPGLIAAIAALLTMALGLASLIVAARIYGQPGLGWTFPLNATRNCGLTVAGAWFVAGYGRVIRKEDGWIDGLGTGLGVYWVAQLVMMYARVFLFAL